MDEFWLGLGLDLSPFMLTSDPVLYQQLELPASSTLWLSVKTLLYLAKVAFLRSVRLCK